MVGGAYALHTAEGRGVPVYLQQSRQRVRDELQKRMVD